MYRMIDANEVRNADFNYCNLRRPRVILAIVIQARPQTAESHFLFIQISLVLHSTSLRIFAYS